MIVVWLCTVTATAATPAELAELAPEARDQLARCELEGCDDDAAARAAWILALDTYVSSGLADGRLAATVRVLDPELFEALPEVLRREASVPLGWVGEPRPVAAVSEPATDAESLEALPWRLPPLTVVAVDTDGRPVPSAVVRFADEQDRHRVHTETGVWTGSLLYLPDGGERAFLRGDTVQMEVFAPGYAYTRDAYLLPRKRRNEIEVVLEPREFEAPAAPEVGRQAVEAWRRWIAAEAGLLELPTEDSSREADHARAETARLAREWMDLGGGEDARELCLMTGSLALCGG